MPKTVRAFLILALSTAGGCAHSVHLDPAAYQAAGGTPESVPEQVGGMSWSRVEIESGSGQRQLVPHAFVSPPQLSATDVRCLRFERRTAGRVWAFGGVAGGAGLLGGMFLGAALLDNNGNVVSNTAPVVLLAGAVGLATFGLGAAVGHWTAGPEPMPANSCTPAPTPRRAGAGRVTRD